MWPNPQETVDLVTFTEEIPNENFIFYAVKNVHVSIFSISRQAFFIKSAREALCVIRQFLPANIFEIFLFDSPSFINTNFNVRNS